MPIIGRTPADCFNVFEAHVRELIALTVSDRHHVQAIRSGDSRAILGFVSGAPTAVPIETRLGTLHFYLGQALAAVPEGGQFRLETHQYWYRIQQSADPRDKNALIRWEYDKTVPADRHPRHHLHLDAEITLGIGSIHFNDVHVPTGWVTMEEVLRFLICELALPPPCGKSWPAVVRESERRFYEDFTSKRYEAPAEGISSSRLARDDRSAL